jgi:hypothetical protein
MVKKILVVENVPMFKETPIIKNVPMVEKISIIFFLDVEEISIVENPNGGKNIDS